MDEVTIQKVGSSYPVFKMLIDGHHLSNKAVLGTTKKLYVVYLVQCNFISIPKIRRLSPIRFTLDTLFLIFLFICFLAACPNTTMFCLLNQIKLYESLNS